MRWERIKFDEINSVNTNNGIIYNYKLPVLVSKSNINLNIYEILPII